MDHSSHMGGGPGGSVAGVSNLPISDSVRTQLADLVAKLSQLVELLSAQAKGGGPVQQGGGCDSPKHGGGGHVPHVSATQPAGSDLASLTQQAQETIAQAQQVLGGGTGTPAQGGGGTPAQQGGYTANYGGLGNPGASGGGPIDPLTGVETAGSSINFEVLTDAQRQANIDERNAALASAQAPVPTTPAA